MSTLSILKASFAVNAVHLECAAESISARVSSLFARVFSTAAPASGTSRTGDSSMVGGAAGARSVRLIVGLGNYSMSPNMRHSVGYQVLDRMAERHQLSWSTNRQIKGMVAEVGGMQSGGDFNSEMLAASKDGTLKPRVILLKPKLFMNLSGDAVARAIKHYSVSVTHVLVVHDDLERDLGKISIKESGSASGHNGVRSIISQTRSQAFPRVRVGIGRPGASKAAVKDFVLKDFGREEMITLKHGNSVDGLHASGSGVLDAACEAINQWIDRGEGSKAAKLPRPPRVKKPKNNLESVESSSDVTAS